MEVLKFLGLNIALFFDIKQLVMFSLSKISKGGYM